MKATIITAERVHKHVQQPYLKLTLRTETGAHYALAVSDQLYSAVKLLASMGFRCEKVIDLKTGRDVLEIPPEAPTLTPEGLVGRELSIEIKTENGKTFPILIQP